MDRPNDCQFCGQPVEPMEPGTEAVRLFADALVLGDDVLMFGPEPRRPQEGARVFFWCDLEHFSMWIHSRIGS